MYNKLRYTENIFAWYPVWTNRGLKWWCIVRKRVNITEFKNKIRYIAI